MPNLRLVPSDGLPIDDKDLPPGGGGGDDGGMEARITKLEQIAEKTQDKLGRLEADMAVIKSQLDGFSKHYATKADVTDAKNSIIMWVVGAIFLSQLLPSVLKLFGR